MLDAKCKGSLRLETQGPLQNMIAMQKTDEISIFVPTYSVQNLYIMFWPIKITENMPTLVYISLPIFHI